MGLLTTTAASKILGCGRTQVNYLIGAGKIPAESVDTGGMGARGMFVLDEDDVLAYKRKQESGRGDERGAAR